MTRGWPVGVNGRGWLLLALAVVTAWLGMRWAPVPYQEASSARQAPTFVLEEQIPAEFGEWRLVVRRDARIVSNPEIQAILDRLYSQLLARTYVNRSGYRVMLSIAYGEDQRGGLQAHRPEVCYPGQGFRVVTNELADIQTSLGTIAGRRLETVRRERHEPLTYWFSIGSKPVSGRLQRRLEEVRLVLTGRTPEGLLFRVSSIDKDAPQAYAMQERFVADLMAALPPQARQKIAGL
jgi:EpsI family protein